MNFLLYMLGRGYRAADATAGARDSRMSQAAQRAARGDLAGAVDIYRDVPERSGIEVLIRGHLQLARGESRLAHQDFALGGHRMLSRGRSLREDLSLEEAGGRHGARRNVPDTAVERLLSRADQCLQRGRFVRGADLLHDTRRLLDILMGAQAGLFVAERRMGEERREQPASLSALLPLARLSDIALRLLARTHLAAHLADSLRKRQLREDLATWATTGQSIDALLESEFQRLSEAARTTPGHAEVHYRLGLIARVTQRLEAAEKAFRQALRLHPAHVSSAAFLAATQAQLKREVDVKMLDRAFAASAEMLRTFAAFARASRDAAQFDQAVERLCAGLRGDAERAAARANIAFALSELSILDSVHAAWRESVPA